MLIVSQRTWDGIHHDYRGRWSAEMVEYQDLPPHYAGKRTVLSGCISDEMGSLLTEGAHFVILPNRMVELREAIIGRLVVEGVTDPTPEELVRALDPCVCGPRLVEWATQLIALGALTAEDLARARA